MKLATTTVGCTLAPTQ